MHTAWLTSSCNIRGCVLEVAATSGSRGRVNQNSGGERKAERYREGSKPTKQVELIVIGQSIVGLALMYAQTLRSWSEP